MLRQFSKRAYLFAQLEAAFAQYEALRIGQGSPRSLLMEGLEVQCEMLQGQARLVRRAPRYLEAPFRCNAETFVQSAELCARWIDGRAASAEELDLLADIARARHTAPTLRFLGQCALLESLPPAQRRALLPSLHKQLRPLEAQLRAELKHCRRRLKKLE